MVGRSGHLHNLVVEHTARAEAAYARFKASPSSTQFNDLAMECFQATNYAISLMERAVEERGLGEAITYADLVELLERGGLITRDECRQLKRLIRLRNLVAHEYHTINDEELEEMFGLLKKAKSVAGRLAPQ